MAIVSGTVQTFSRVGIREDLTDVIYNISPEETPFISNAGRTKVSNTYHEWQEDSLAAVDTANKHIQGDEASFSAPAATTRRGNYTQISRKTVIIAGTAEAVDKAGRKSELAYQVAKLGKELRRDMEAIALSNQGGSAGATGTAATTGSLLAFIKTNVDKASDGANPTYTTAASGTRTDGTARAFTETILKNVMQLCWTSGATPKMLMVGAVNKQTVSGFSGIATKTLQQTSPKSTAIIGAADVYVSDFGTLSVVANRFQRSRDAFFLDPEHMQIGYLRPFKQEPLAKTGDAEKRLMLVEWMVKVGAETGLGLAADLTA